MDMDNTTLGNKMTDEQYALCKKVGYLKGGHLCYADFPLKLAITPTVGTPILLFKQERNVFKQIGAVN